MNKYISIIFAILVFAISNSYASESEAKVSTDLSGMRSGITYYGHSYKISWSRDEFDKRKIDKWIGGDSFDPPRYVLTSVELSIDKENIYLPSSIYDDIYNPSSIGPFLMDDGEAVYLVIYAGDGAGSAEVWIKIENGAPIVRRVKEFGPDGEFKFRN